jgi:hypothetical protein
MQIRELGEPPPRQTSVLPVKEFVQLEKFGLVELTTIVITPSRSSSA